METWLQRLSCTCVLMLSSVRVINSAESVFNVKCRPAVGVIGQITNISCSIESQTGNVIINAVSLTRFRENKPCFTFQPYENRVTGDSRFKGESLPSLQLHNTAISDEGGYKYYISTKQGYVNAECTINVTAKYRSPIITSELTVLEDGRAADLYCRSSGGYPAGTIHWFDKSNTNWTQNSTLQITQGHDGLFTLSSKLSFRSNDSTWGPFWCVVLNYRYEEEGQSTSDLKIKDDQGSAPPMTSTVKAIITGVIVIGFLIVCLLIACRVFHQRRRRRQQSRDSAAVNRVAYARAADAEETVTVIPNNTEHLIT